jgi:TRAP-type C4-dicarboxylate transport system permease small subunit
LKVLTTINRILQKIEIAIGAVIVAAIFLLTLLNIVMRYFFSAPLFWCEEVILYSFIWLGFLTVAYTLANDKHVRFSLFLDKFKGKAYITVQVLIDLMIIAVLAILLPSAIRVIPFLIKTPALKIPEKYMYIILPISYCIMMYHSAINMIGRFKQPEKKEEQ